jgi:hypothetical protein
MTNLDEFWELANKKHVRAVSLHGWQGEEFDFAKKLETITWTIDQLDLWPSRVEIYQDKKFRAKVCRWKNKSEANLDQFNSIRGVSIISGLRHKLSTMDFALRSIHLSNDRPWPWMYIQGGPDCLTLPLGMSIVSKLLKHITPTYGFSTYQEKEDSYWFHSGIPTGDLSEVQHARVDAHDQIKHVKKETKRSLAHRLLDVFELNIINPNHLEIQVGSMSLKQWIASGNNGTVQQLKPDVFAWFVPDHIRPQVRDTLLKSGCLVVPI